ncbi:MULTISPECIES: arginine repressor [unclassified Ruminococcus]|uniref:arginine repressor n=1 Tax=unclassified Ruminococcus TaxID=2608920 RepID=UPI00210995A7|nr:MULTISPECIES: arginine repressor [unclassified Ruminococcus]MCQ4022261.1 arginine repressor [Ruminococcus sp. zg-924]MCQ4114589.1 arginine repressor [Ruminococcus sp. zg-921]
MKSKRQTKILELISTSEINTQDSLLAKLNECGFNVTQATVSRDIKELKLQKVVTSGGKYKYASASKVPQSLTGSFNSLFSGSVTSIDYAGNMIVLKTVSGMAQGVCAAMDAVEIDGVVGTIAGDDTIFVVARNDAQAASIVSFLKKIV